MHYYLRKCRVYNVSYRILSKGFWCFCFLLSLDESHFLVSRSHLGLISKVVKYWLQWGNIMTQNWPVNHALLRVAVSCYLDLSSESALSPTFKHEIIIVLRFAFTGTTHHKDKLSFLYLNKSWMGQITSLWTQLKIKTLRWFKLSLTDWRSSATSWPCHTKTYLAAVSKNWSHVSRWKVLWTFYFLCWRL